jgi:hypothetical protein
MPAYNFQGDVKPNKEPINLETANASKIIDDPPSTMIKLFPSAVIPWKKKLSNVANHKMTRFL